MSATKPTYPPIAVNAMISAMNKHGITNPYLQTGILGTVGKETGFVLRPEVGYGNTSNSRIRSIFKNRVADLSEDALTSLKKNDVAFFEKVYGMQTKIGKDLGNTQYGDGYKYRGRGFNGLTGRGQYKSYGAQMGLDLVGNPDLLNQIPIAAEYTVLYYQNNFSHAEKNGNMKSSIGVDKASDVKNIAQGIKIAVQATGGWWGKDLTEDFRAENLKRATEAANTILQEAANYTMKAVDTVKKNPGTTIAILFFFGAATIAYIKRGNIKQFFKKHAL